jgi:sortase A
VKLRIERRALRSALRWSQRLLAAAAALALGYCAVVLVDGWAYQKTERRQLDQLLESRPVRAASSPVTPMVQAGGLIGRLDIARLNISVIVVEGVGGRVLRRAAGHIPGTALPGHIGNVGISAHRDTFFRPLRNIRQNDIITVTTPLGEYRYRVLSTTIVGPDDVTVLHATGGENLTLVTCYPFYFIGPAPSRFIVRAERVT